MDTTVLWQDESATIQVGDVMVASEDVADNYCSGSGLMNEEGTDNGSAWWVGRMKWPLPY